MLGMFILFVLMVSLACNMPQLIKRYTGHVCSLLYVSYASVKLLQNNSNVLAHIKTSSVRCSPACAPAAPLPSRVFVSLRLSASPSLSLPASLYYTPCLFLGFSLSLCFFLFLPHLLIVTFFFIVSLCNLVCIVHILCILIGTLNFLQKYLVCI